MQWLRPGGIFLAEYFSKDQLNMSSGGPKNPSLLYHIDDLKNDFAGNEIEIAEEKLIELNEGEFHQGNAWVNRLKILKPNDQ